MACTPTVTCNRWDLQSPATQKYLLLQLLAAANTKAGGDTYTLSQLKAAAADWICQGSPAKIDEQIAQFIASDLTDVDTDQPVCWTPLELEGALAYILCQLLATINAP